MEVNVQKYMAFVKTVEWGSFSKAGEILGYSQSGISRMIHDLEAEWQISLLDRDRNGVRLTSDGMRLLPYAKHLCHVYEEMQRAAHDLRQLETGVIRMAVFSSIATHWLPPIIRKFQDDYPGIDYELLLGDYKEIEDWIAQGRVDCGFLRLPTKTEFDTIPIMKDELMAVIPKGHPLAKQRKFPVEAFAKEPFMLLERSGQSEAADFLKQCHVEPHVKFITWDDYAIMSMVEQGLGMGILSHLILQRTHYHIDAKPMNPPAYRQIVLAMKDRTSLSWAMKKFLEYLPIGEC